MFLSKLLIAVKKRTSYNLFLQENNLGKKHSSIIILYLFHKMSRKKPDAVADIFLH